MVADLNSFVRIETNDTWLCQCIVDTKSRLIFTATHTDNSTLASRLFVPFDANEDGQGHGMPPSERGNKTFLYLEYMEPPKVPHKGATKAVLGFLSKTMDEMECWVGTTLDPRKGVDLARLAALFGIFGFVCCNDHGRDNVLIRPPKDFDKSLGSNLRQPKFRSNVNI